MTKPLTLVLTGGGTGGHITPILAVAHELKRQRPDVRLVYIGERKGKFAELTRNNPDIDEVYSIFAGKFRRYHGRTWLQRVLDVQTLLLNLRDALYVLLGIVQSYILLGRVQPDGLFQKGGYVGMPVGLAAAARKIPFVTHDSDTVPGLANRVVSRWAYFNATGMPAKYYPYPGAKVRHVGVLLAKEYKPVDAAQQRQYREELAVPAKAQTIFVTGGSQGAQSINRAFVKIAADLLERHPDLYILHQVGKGNAGAYGDYHNDRLRVEEFVTGLYRYSGAADLIVTRAGATNLAEFGTQGKACLVIPHPYLTGGHQLKNTEYLLQQDAVAAVDEGTLTEDPAVLVKEIEELLGDTKQRIKLGKKLQALTPDNATQAVATLLLEVAHG